MNQDIDRFYAQTTLLYQQYVEKCREVADIARKPTICMESPKVCGNCIHGKSTCLDDTRCYVDTPYLPTGRHCRACRQWEPCGTSDNPRI